MSKLRCIKPGVDIDNALLKCSKVDVSLKSSEDCPESRLLYVVTGEVVCDYAKSG